MAEEKTRKIKICYVVSVDITLKFILFNHLKFLKNEGYDIYAACSDGKWIKEIENYGIRVKTIQFKRKFFTPFSDLAALISLIFYFKKEKFDIVHTHTPKAGFLGQLAAKISGIPIIVNTIHGLYFTEDSAFFKTKVFALIEKIAAKCSDIIFFVNKEDMDTAVEKGICRAGIMRYFGGGINIENFNPENFSEQAILKKKKEFGISQDSMVIGIVARLVKEKGYLEIFRAFKRILVDFPKTKLLAVGPLEPEKKDAIHHDIVKKYNIGKNTLFLGERTDVNEIYSLMDVFVLPSHREGLGISIIEASAMEKPVVATNIRGCREVVEHGKTGLLVRVNDSRELAKAIVFLLKNPQKAKEMGKAGRRKMLKEFDERLVLDRIKEEYERLIKEKLK